MFSFLRPPTGIRHHVTDDLDLSAYLYLRGSKLQGWEILDNGFKQFVFTHRRMASFLHDWHNHAPIRFAPKAFLEYRHRLKFIDRRSPPHFGSLRAQPPTDPCNSSLSPRTPDSTSTTED